MPKAAERRLFRPKYAISAEIALSAERSIFAKTFLHLPKPKLSAESRKRALSVDYYLKVVLHPHVSLRGERHTVELIPIPVVSLFDVAPTVVRQIQPQEIRGTEIRHRVAV